MGRTFDALVIGGSAGGLLTLAEIIPKLPKEFISVIIVMHIKANSENFTVPFLAGKSKMLVKEAEPNEAIQPGVVYVAPPSYHLLIEPDRSFAYSLEAPVKYSRPSIDVLFESAALAYQQSLIGLLLTGANDDGSLGLKKIKDHGGLLMVQDPETANSPEMPRTAITLNKVDLVVPLEKIADKLIEIILPN